MTDHCIGSCDFEEIALLDLNDAVRTLGGRSTFGAYVPPPGQGPDLLIEWAIQEIGAAYDATGEERQRHATNAVMNARRSLSCLVDWYMLRDGFSFCSDKPTRAPQKADLLERRGVLSPLTSRVLARAVDVRNVAEHQYSCPSLAEAEDVTELIRLTIASMRESSRPEAGGCIYGGFPYSLQFGEQIEAEFGGWDQATVVFWRDQQRPWVGIVDPRGPDQASVRRCYLAAALTSDLLQLVTTLETSFGPPSGSSPQRGWELLLRQAGVLE